MTRRVYVPNPASEKLGEAKKQLYLLRTAILTENEEKLKERIDGIRKILVEAAELLE